MQVIDQEDGSFYFLFSQDEKQLGLAILNSLKTHNQDSKDAIEIAKDTVRCAGLPKPTAYN